jgi:hypothetical protein
MHTPRLLLAIWSYAALVLTVAAQNTPAVADASRMESTPATRRVFTGRVLLPNRSPATSTVVVTSAGGQTITREDGSFELAVEVPNAADKVQVTAVAGSDLMTSASVAVLSSLRLVDVGTLALAPTTSCQASWLPTFGGYPGAGGVVLALAVFDDGSGPSLYVGGNLDSAGAVEVNNIAKWTGAKWCTVGSGIDGNVNALAAFSDGTAVASPCMRAVISRAQVASRRAGSPSGTVRSGRRSAAA